MVGEIYCDLSNAVDDQRYVVTVGAVKWRLMDQEQRLAIGVDGKTQMSVNLHAQIHFEHVAIHVRRRLRTDAAQLGDKNKEIIRAMALYTEVKLHAMKLQWLTIDHGFCIADI